MLYRYSKYLHPIVLSGDLVIVNSTMIIAFLTFYENFTHFNDRHAILFTVINLLWITSSLLLRTHAIARISHFNKIFREILGNVFLNVLAISTLLIVMGFHLSLTVHFLVFYAVLLVGISAWRGIYRYFIQLYRKFGFNYRSFAIIGHGKLSEELVRFFKGHPEYGFNYLGYFNQQKSGEGFLGSVDELSTYLKTNRIDEIYCVPPYLHETLLNRIIRLGEKHFISVKIVSDGNQFQGKALDVQLYGDIPVLEATTFPMERKKNRINKRIFDVLFSLGVLLMLSWLFPLIALAIKLETAGPVFFIQRRSGQGNNKFWCLKFRTMYMNEEADKIQATKNDVRVTKVGAFLRRTSLDELPQFFNVLLGNMSVVGPRPYMIHHTQLYSQQMERFMARYFVKPGITGLAQCKGYRGEIKTREALKNRLKLDNFYISKWSIFFDISIVLKTIMVVIRGDEKAY